MVVAPLEEFAGVNVPCEVDDEITGADVFAQERAHIFARNALAHELHPALDPRREQRFAVFKIHDRDVFRRGLEVFKKDGERALSDRAVTDKQDFILE